MPSVITAEISVRTELFSASSARKTSSLCENLREATEGFSVTVRTISLLFTVASSLVTVALTVTSPSESAVITPVAVSISTMFSGTQVYVTVALSVKVCPSAYARETEVFAVLETGIEALSADSTTEESFGISTVPGAAS